MGAWYLPSGVQEEEVQRAVDLVEGERGGER